MPRTARSMGYGSTSLLDYVLVRRGGRYSSPRSFPPLPSTTRMADIPSQLRNRSLVAGLATVLRTTPGPSFAILHWKGFVLKFFVCSSTTACLCSAIVSTTSLCSSHAAMRLTRDDTVDKYQRDSEEEKENKCLDPWRDNHEEYEVHRKRTETGTALLTACVRG